MTARQVVPTRYITGGVYTMKTSSMAGTLAVVTDGHVKVNSDNMPYVDALLMYKQHEQVYIHNQPFQLHFGDIGGFVGMKHEYTKAYQLAKDELTELHDLCSSLARIRAYWQDKQGSLIELNMIANELGKDVGKKQAELDAIQRGRHEQR